MANLLEPVCVCCAHDGLDMRGMPCDPGNGESAWVRVLFLSKAIQHIVQRTEFFIVSQEDPLEETMLERTPGLNGDVVQTTVIQHTAVAHDGGIVFHVDIQAGIKDAAFRNTELHLIHNDTYSSGIGFVYQLLEMFQKAEIVFGCDEVISYSLQEIMAYQCKTIERLRESASKRKIDLVARIEKGTLRFFVARNVLSHEKIYLLSAEDGRKRIVMGSANMSFAAFGGKQRENISYIDGDKAYDWYWDCYCQLKEESTDEVAQESLLCADDAENLEQLPIARTIQVKKALVLQPVQEAKEEVRFVLDIKNLAAKFSTAVPKPDKKGKLMLSPEKIKTIRRQVVAGKTKEKELQSKYPQLEIFPDEGLVRLNDATLALQPSHEEVAKDIGLFLKYMDGYEKFNGDKKGMQRRYFEFANWFFCSPFMACMRDMAVRYNQNLLPYPVFGLVYGQSKAGKTSFLETLLKMMIGQKTKISAPDFTRSSIEGLKRTVKGAPIIVDDLTIRK